MIHEEGVRSEALEVDALPEAVPQVRRWVRGLLAAWDRSEALDDAELAVTELVGNVVLHAPGPARIVVIGRPDGLRLEVNDINPVRPVRRTVTEGGTTGRGLNLVTALAQAWGVSARDDDMPGKVVWCQLGAGSDAARPDLDADAVLGAFDAEPVGYEVTVGDAPTALLAAAKDHLDGLLRECALAESSVGGALPSEVVEGITRAVARFAEARRQLRRQLTRAGEQGLDRVVLRFALPGELADAGEDYLRALAEADTFAQDRRLLSLESPVAFRVLREWYVEGLVLGLRQAQAGRPARGVESFEQRLLRELQEMELRNRESALAAQLQQVTARLASAQNLSEIAEAVVVEGALALGATGGTLTRPGNGFATPVVEWGADEGLAARYGGDPSRPVGPSTEAIRTGRPVFVEGREEHGELFAHLAALQPEAASLAVLPLLVAGEVVGALRFSFATPHVFSTSERAYLEGLAAQTAQAVARADALQRLRQAEGRSRTLARLGERLAAAGSMTSLLEAVSDVIVPDLGDWLAVHLVDDQGRIWCPFSRHREAHLSRALDDLFRRFLVTVDQPYGAGRVIATGATQELTTVTEEELRAVAPDDEEFLALMREVELRNGAIVPLVARGRTVGALSVARSGQRALSPADVSMVEDVGRRAGVALDTVRILTTSVRLDLALSAASVGSFDMHLPDGELDWDERLYAMLDVDPLTFDGTLESFFARVVEEDAERTAVAIARAVETVGELAVDYRVRRRDGAIRWIEGRGRALPGPDGRAERLLGVAVDVTEQRDASARAVRSLELMAVGFLQLDRDWVITYANSEAERLTGMRRDDMVGTSLWDSFPGTVGTVFEDSYRRAASTGQPVRFEAHFPPLDSDYEVRAFPGPEGLALYFTDVSQRRTTERERDRALERLRLLNDVGAALTETLDVDEALTRLAHRMVPAIADLVSIDLRDQDDVGGAREVVITAADPARADALRRADAVLPRRHNPGSAVHRVLSGEPYLRIEVRRGYLESVAVDEAQLQTYLDIDMRHAVVVPLAARGRVFGVLSLIRTGPQAPPYTDDDVPFVLEIGRRAGLIVDNAAQYTAQRVVAEGLQRSLLPELPEAVGMQLGAAYEPSSSQAKVGGDWYDAFVLPDDALGLVIGDVMGHDIAAAAAMGQLRSVLRTCAADGDGPAEVLDRLDRLVTSFAMADLATVVYARVARRPDGSAELAWANAGHPPPLLLVPRQPARFLHGGGSTMIGVEVGAARQAATEELPAGSTLLMYTDGLVERRGVDLDVRLELLRITAERLLAESDDPDTLCHNLIAAVRREGSADDAAAVALTLR